PRRPVRTVIFPYGSPLPLTQIGPPATPVLAPVAALRDPLAFCVNAGHLWLTPIFSRPLRAPRAYATPPEYRLPTTPARERREDGAAVLRRKSRRCCRLPDLPAHRVS